MLLEELDGQIKIRARVFQLQTHGPLLRVARVLGDDRGEARRRRRELLRVDALAFLFRGAFRGVLALDGVGAFLLLGLALLLGRELARGIGETAPGGIAAAMAITELPVACTAGALSAFRRRKLEGRKSSPE